MNDLKLRWLDPHARVYRHLSFYYGPEGSQCSGGVISSMGGGTRADPEGNRHSTMEAAMEATERWLRKVLEEGRDV